MGGGNVWTVVAGVCGVDGEVYDLYLYGCPHRVARRHQVVGLVTFGYVCLPEGKMENENGGGSAEGQAVITASSNADVELDVLLPAKKASSALHVTPPPHIVGSPAPYGGLDAVLPASSPRSTPTSCHPKRYGSCVRSQAHCNPMTMLVALTLWMVAIAALNLAQVSSSNERKSGDNNNRSGKLNKGLLFTIGTISAALYLLRWLPQIWLNYQLHTCGGMSAMYLMLAFLASVCDLVTGFCLDLPLPSKVSPVFQGCLVAVVIGQKWAYDWTVPELGRA